jgi:hypothetical protein
MKLILSLGYRKTEVPSGRIMSLQPRTVSLLRDNESTSFFPFNCADVFVVLSLVSPEFLLFPSPFVSTPLLFP